MSQVSKIDAALLSIASMGDKSIHDVFEKSAKFSQKEFDEHKAKLLSIILEALPEKNKLSEKYENLGKDGGIDTTIYDSDEDPNNTKNGEALAHLAQFAGDTGYNTALDEVKTAINVVFGVER